MSFRRTLIAALIAGTGMLVAAPATAQNTPFSVEVRTGATFPLGDLSDAGAESDLLLALDGYYSFSPALSLYAGWARHGFDCAACASNVSVSGPRGGLKVLFPMPGAAMPWVRGGVTFNEVDGLVDAASNRSLGLEAGAGIDYAISPRLSITPAVRYEAFSADYDVGDASITFVTLDLGLHLHL